MTDTYLPPAHGWTCFHCGETFTKAGDARDHFGATPASIAGCLIKAGDDLGLLMAVRKAEREAERLRQAMNTPELYDFARGVVLEAAHQRQRWGDQHDAGKEPADWFWLLGYLAGKALHAAIAGNTDKVLHHTISSAAALANWHAAAAGVDTAMRPGIDPVARGLEAAEEQPP